MSETHLQVESNGEKIERKTIIIPSKMEDRKKILTSIFSQIGWSVISCENVAGSNWNIVSESSFINKQFKIDLYIGSIRDEDRKIDEFKMQLGNSYPRNKKDGYIQMIMGIYSSNEMFSLNDLILAVYSPFSFDFATNPSLRGTRTSGLQSAKIFGLSKVSDSCVIFRPEFIYYILDQIDNNNLFDSTNLISKTKIDIISSPDIDIFEKDLALAMRTKPFLLLAGISGTGKSRIVKQMAFESCPNMDALRKDPTSPGNYQLIEVKPNWHDSTELLGYESQIGKPHYQLKPFVKFLAKAMLYPDVPFFVCLDEMNLAPVEQYFAEFLSVLESRTKLEDGKITSEPLIKADIFSNKDYELKLQDELFGLELKEETTDDGSQRIISGQLSADAQKVYDRLKAEGLRIPSNLIVVGTVNMDETTHQFSRKVIDRAMTIEMNIEDAETPFKDFFEGGDAQHYYDNPQPRELFLPKVVQANDALAQLSEEDAEYLKANVPQLLYNLNKALDGTPFKIAYRVQNELVLYFYSLREEKPDTDAETLLASAMDAILMMKVLPRIEGDEDLLEKPLKALADFTVAYPQASKKIAEMQQRLPQAHFTSFWP